MNYSLEEENITKIYKHIKLLFVPSIDNGYQPRFLQSKLLTYAVFFILIIKILSIAFILPLPQNIFFADITKSNLIQLLNNERISLGVGTLTESDKLNKAALLKAQDMVQKNYFSHESPQGITPWFWFNQVGYVYKYAGENLAVGFINSGDVYNGWFNSPSHKSNMINPNYKEVGTAIIQGFGENNVFVVVQLFGSPLVKNSNTVVDSNTKITPKITPPKNTEQANIDPPIVINEITEVAKETPENEITSDVATEQTDFNLSEKVLSESINIFTLRGAKEIGKNSLYLKVLNFIKYGDEKTLQNISYTFIWLLGIPLLLQVMINFESVSRKIFLKSLLFMGLIYVSTLISEEAINLIVPHSIIIQ